MKRLAVFLLLPALLLSACTGYGTADLSIIPSPVELRQGRGFCNGTTVPAVRISASLAGKLGEEGYELSVRKHSVHVRAASDAGAFYAMQTLSQLRELNGGEVPCVKIADRPRFEYRGFHMDVSRYFFDKAHVLRTLDWLAFYKFNNFHLHLTDNGGWRMEIKSHPELVEHGAWRTVKDWDSWFEWFEPREFCTQDTPGCYGGYFTQEELREIVAYADSLHINVIPEIEFPAHSDAVFASHPELKCLPDAVSHDALGDFCPSSDEVFEFAKDVLTEVMDVFPSKLIHIGGDEAQKKDWARCPRCRALMESEGMESVDALQSYLIRRIERFLEENGRQMAGWDEILKNDDLLPTTVSYSYRGEKGAIEAANRGLRTVMTPGEVLYCDWYQAKPRLEPKAMYGYAPIRKQYSFYPLPDSPQKALSNEILIQEQDVDPASVQWILPENTGNVYGVQGCLWAEYVPDNGHHDYMMFPRVCAIAELAWTLSDEKDWPGFRRRMNRHLALQRSHGVQAFDLHNAPYIEASVVDGRTIVSIDREVESCEIRYTLDGTMPDRDSYLYESPFEIMDSVTVRARVFGSDGMESFVETVDLVPGQQRREYYLDSYKQ